MYILHVLGYLIAIGTITQADHYQVYIFYKITLLRNYLHINIILFSVC